MFLMLRFCCNAQATTDIHLRYITIVGYLVVLVVVVVMVGSTSGRVLPQ